VSTIFGCLSVGLLLAVTIVAVRLGGAMLARQQAETAADLGALAGAAQILHGSAAACAAAGRVVTANSATMTSCTADGLDVLVEVDARAPALGGIALAHARAGPVSTP
jgi:secretion/DNA translocation related TadE-like protein